MPLDLQKLLELAPFAIGALKPGSPEAAALMRGYQRGMLLKQQQEQQRQGFEQDQAFRQAQIENLSADNRRADEQLRLTREGNDLQRTKAYRGDLQSQLSALATKPETMLPAGTDPLQAQNALVVNQLQAQQQYGIPAGTPQPALPNMTALVSEGKKRRAKARWDAFNKEYGDQAADASKSLTDGSGEFAGMTFDAIRQMAESVPAAPPKSKDKKYTKIDTVDEKGRPVTKVMAEEDAAGQTFPQYVKPDKAEKVDTEKTSPYEAERATRNLQSIDELMGRVSNWTTGWGSPLANMPATDARNFRADLETLKSNIITGELTAMRAASKTGGALGQVSDREGQMLASALGALDQGQSPANIKRNLQRIKESILRWQAAQQRPGVGPAPAGPKRVYYDANGQPVKQP